MARLFPLRSEAPATEGQPRVVDLNDEDADAVFGALSSNTAREIYSRLEEEPGTPSDIAEAIDSSIQNVKYHLEKLEGAGLIEVVDTWYSSRGNEMSVYATADGPLIVTSDQSTASQLKTALSRFIGGVAALAGGSLLVQYGLEQFFAPVSPAPDEAAPATADDTAVDDGTDDAGATAEEEEEEAADTDDTADDDSDAEFGVAEADDEEEADEVADDDAADDPEAEPEYDEEEEPEDDADAADADDPDADDAYADAPPEDGTVTYDGGLEGIDTALGVIPPGALFFLGGLVVLTVVTVYWYWTATY